MNERSAVVYACSPRPDGNTDCAALCLRQGAALAGKELTPIFLRPHPAAPCLSCYACAAAPHDCVLDRTNGTPDGMTALSVPLLRAPVLFFAAPVYFYHLPAQFKAFMDRTQRFYLMKRDNDPRVTSLAKRTAYIVLLGAREWGRKLFEGSLLSLRLMLDTFNIVPAEPLLLYGLDGPSDLSGNRELRSRIVEYARQALSPMENQR